MAASIPALLASSASIANLDPAIIAVPLSPFMRDLLPPMNPDAAQDAHPRHDYSSYHSLAACIRPHADRIFFDLSQP
jgi:hypothetical protein